MGWGYSGGAGACQRSICDSSSHGDSKQTWDFPGRPVAPLNTPMGILSSHWPADLMHEDPSPIIRPCCERSKPSPPTAQPQQRLHVGLQSLCSLKKQVTVSTDENQSSRRELTAIPTAASGSPLSHRTHRQLRGLGRPLFPLGRDGWETGAATREHKHNLPSQL